MRAEQEIERLGFLERLGLARRMGERSWELSPEHEPELRRRQREHDIIKSRAREQQREADRGSGDGEVAVMAEYRPYRVISQHASAQLSQVKLVSVSSFLGLALLINWMVTQHAARLFGYSRLLGPVLIGGIYAPWEWIVWWSRWHGAEQLEPVWELCTREAAYPLLALAVSDGWDGDSGARYRLADHTPDLHGSARWANLREVWATGLMAATHLGRRWLRRRLVSAGLLQAPRRRVGIYLGTWRIGGGCIICATAGRDTCWCRRPRAAARASVRWCRRCLRGHTRPGPRLQGRAMARSPRARGGEGSLCLKFDPTNPE